MEFTKINRPEFLQAHSRLSFVGKLTNQMLRRNPAKSTLWHPICLRHVRFAPFSVHHGAIVCIIYDQKYHGHPLVIKHGNGKWTIYQWFFLSKPPFSSGICPFPCLIIRGYSILRFLFFRQVEPSVVELEKPQVAQDASVNALMKVKKIDPLVILTLVGGFPGTWLDYFFFIYWEW